MEGRRRNGQKEMDRKLRWEEERGKGMGEEKRVWPLNSMHDQWSLRSPEHSWHWSIITRNTLDCDQSNYSSCIVFSHILTEFGPTRNNAIRSADPENPTIEPNMKWIGRPLAKIWPFEIFKIERSVVGRSSVIYRVGQKSEPQMLYT